MRFIGDAVNVFLGGLGGLGGWQLSVAFLRRWLIMANHCQPVMSDEGYEGQLPIIANQLANQILKTSNLASSEQPGHLHVSG